MNRTPIAGKVVQLAMVVKNCEATARRYWEDLGVGPWRFYTLDPSNTYHMTLRGEPVTHAFRAAIAMIGDVELELIEPLEGASLYVEHLSAHGEGLHHIALDVEDFERAKSHLRQRGYTELQSGRPFGVCTYTYFNTQKELACIVELGTKLDEDHRLPEPEWTYPPSP
jgi:methylmalonyl-CoA/ethylmalonyl-CoA epimerase